MITFHHRGNFSHLEKFLMRMSDRAYMKVLEKYGQRGVEALSAATPLDSGKTAASWSYEIQNGPEGAAIYWINSNENQGGKYSRHPAIRPRDWYRRLRTGEGLYQPRDERYI